MAKKLQPGEVDWNAKLKEAKDRYSFKFDEALEAGYPVQQVIKFAEENAPEKTMHRVWRGAGKAWDKTIDDISEKVKGADIGEVIQQAPRKVWEHSVGGHAMKGIGEVVDKVAPWASEPLVPTGKTVKRAVTPPKTAGGVRKFVSGALESALDLPGSLSTPKDMAMLAGIAAFPPAAIALVPEMVLGAWEGGVKGVRSLMSGDSAEAGRQMGGAVISGAMAKGIMGHAKARVERVKVKREVEAAKQAEAEFNAEWDAAKRLREVEVPGTPGIAATMDMPVDRAPVRKIVRPQQSKASAIRLNEQPSGEPIPLGPRAPRRVIIRKPGEVEVVPTKVDVSDAIFPRPRDIEVPGTPGVAVTMEMPADRAPRRTRLNVDEKGRLIGGQGEFEPRDVSDLVKAGALPEFAAITKPYTLWDAIQDTVKKVELSETLDRGYTGEIRDLRQSGVKGAYKGAHEKVVNVPGGKIVKRAGTMDKLREALVEEGIIPPEFTLAEAAEFIKNEQFRHSQGKSAPYTEAKNFNKMMDAEHFELGERADEAAREAQREAKNKPLDPERQAIQAEQGDLTFDVADTMKATFTKEAAADAVSPKRRSKAAQAAEKRALLEEQAREFGMAEAETANMTTKQLIKELVKKGVPRIGLQIDYRSIKEQARQRAIERELARRAGKQMVERAPVAGAAGAADSKPRTFAENPLKETPNVEDAMKKVPQGVSHPDVKASKDLAGGKRGSAMIDTHRGFEEMKRNSKGILKKVHEDAHGKLYDAEKSYAQTMANERKSLLSSLKKIGVKRSTKIMKLVQQFGEGELTLEQVVKQAGKKTADKVVAADKLFRETYDRMHSEINRLRKERGEAQLPKVENYYRHATEFNGKSLIEGLRDALGMEPTITEGAGKLSMTKKRTANLKSEQNALEGFLNYLPQYAWETNITPLKNYFRGALNDINRLTAKSTDTLPATKSFYRKVLRDVSLKKNYWDQTVEKMVSERYGQKGLKRYLTLKKISGTMVRNTVASVSPIVTNFAAYANAAAELGLRDAIKGFARSVYEIGKDKTSDKGYFTPERFASRESRKSSTKFWQRHQPLSDLFEVFDRSFITRPIWNAMFEKGKRLKVSDPVKYADIETGKAVGARGSLDRADWYNSSIGRQLTPFTLEVNNYYRQVKGYLKGRGGTEKTRTRAAIKMTKMMVASYLINEMLEEITGHPVLFDPIQATLEALEEKDPALALGRLIGEAIELLPSGNLAAQVIPREYRKGMFGRNDPGRYGMIWERPMRGALKLGKAAYRKATGGRPVEGVYKAALDVVGGFIPKLPGAQIKKTGAGLAVINRGGKTSFGKTPVDIDISNPLEVARLLMFGPYATKGMREVIEKQTKR